MQIDFNSLIILPMFGNGSVVGRDPFVYNRNGIYIQIRNVQSFGCVRCENRPPLMNKVNIIPTFICIVAKLWSSVTRKPSEGAATLF